MTSQRRSFDGIPSRYENPYIRFYICDSMRVRRKKEDHLFKCVDEAMVDELRRIEAQQAIIEEEIEDWKKCLKKADERVDVGCIGIIQWLFERVCN
ncbi:BnaC01g21500D [Brassica napus]|uniref:BnaC01g21500D protein n=2 Tax=Brassica TaxID=3705 RepID=A0A078HFP4_BRANA|nr:BnaC01g21500D [Brassica napus]VDD50124.1 unnamed protein product [Brassica oleracea]